MVAGLAAASPVLQAADAPGWNRNAFSAKSFAEVVKALGGSAPAESRDVILEAPEIAEDGSAVRFTVQSRLAGTTQLALVVDRNPFALAALFDIPAGTDAAVTTQLKMQESSRVVALARVGERNFYAARHVTVTLGGCAN
jgi:sulfur-oxidizing protein SoxY